MTRTEDQRLSTRPRISRWGLVALALAIGGSAIALRWMIPTQHATAQIRRSAHGQALVAEPRPTATDTPQQTATPERQPGTSETAGQNIAAVVNGVPITRQTIGRECLARWGEETLESLVNKQLIMDACQARNIVITDQDIENELDSISRKFNMSSDQYLKMLREERNVSESGYRRDILWPAIALERLADDKIIVTQDQLDREYESMYGPKVQVRMISLTNPAQAAKVCELAKANPEQFERLAKQYSEDPTSASAKGLIPPVRKHMGEPAVEQAVFVLKPGEVSDVVHAANQYFIFRCEHHVGPATISPQFRQEANSRLRQQIKERNLREVSGEIFKELQSAAKIVNVMNDPKLSKQSAGVAAFVNRKPITLQTLTEECVFRYGREMVETEINHQLLTQALRKRNLTVSTDGINEEVTRAARSFGYVTKNDEADVEAWVKAVTEQEGIGVKEYIRDAVWPTVALKQLVGNKVTVTEEDLKKGFEANYGERVEVLAIVLGNQRTAQTVWDMARNKTSKEFFGQLAEQYSIEQVSRANFGEIPPIQRHGGQPQIEKEAFDLAPGELSGIIAVGEKYIILKCLGRTEPVVHDLQVVRSELEGDIRETKMRMAMAEEFDRLRGAAQIDNFIAGTSQTGAQFGPKPSRPAIPVRPVSSASDGVTQILKTKN